MLIYDVFLISNFPPSNFIKVKKEGEDVFTVSKFLIFVLIPVIKANIAALMQILWSERLGTLIVLLLAIVIHSDYIVNLLGKIPFLQENNFGLTNSIVQAVLLGLSFYIITKFV